MRSFIIHMPTDVSRAPNVQKLLAGLPEAEVVTAVNGRDELAAGRVRTRPGDLHTPAYPFALSPGEVGCFLSHRACWQRIVADNLDYALIGEDDLALDPELWPHVQTLIETHATPQDVIRIPARDREKPVHVRATSGPAQLFLPRVIGLQTVCQVVGRDAAARLLAASEIIDRPVDTFLQMHWITGQPVHTILPSGMRELTRELGGSTIQKKTRAGSKPAREIKRAIYRAQVALRPQKPDQAGSFVVRR